MKALFILFLFSFSNTPISYKQLTWADFKGKPTNDHLASTCSGIVIEKDTAYAVFEPDKSWTRTNDVATLRHEQLHFAITKYWAEKVCEAQKRNVKIGFTLNEYIADYLSQWDLMEARYDFETNHGQDAEAQRQWEEKIKL